MILRKIKNNENGVSQIVGTILLIVTALSLFTVVNLLVLSTPAPYHKPYVNIIGHVEDDQIILEHYGGESLDLDTYVEIDVGGTKRNFLIDDGLNSNDKSNGFWNFGETAIYNVGDIEGVEVSVNLINQNHNFLIMYGLIQEGEGSTTVSLDTSVDIINPYEQTSSPLTVTATGDSELDSVSLYYRYASISGPISYDNLVYDDFENGFGNYTDGGVDCWLYDMGLHSGHERCSINIQDNSGDESSFFITNGIDVDNPGYSLISVDFIFKPVNYENGENFFVKYYNGSGWQVAADFVCGIDFENDQFYQKQVLIDESKYNFHTDMKIKFQSDAGDNGDDIYVDNVYINASDAISTFSEWTSWVSGDNPDDEYPWSWSFDFPDGDGYYEFYSIGEYGGESESAPSLADSSCIFDD